VGDSLSELETILEPVRELYGRDLTPVCCVAVMVADVLVLLSEAERLQRVESVLREPRGG